MRFQSTPPVKAATCSFDLLKVYFIISIHAAREGGDGHGIDARIDHIAISIHAAREGGDCTACALICSFFISIHAAREGGDPLLIFTSSPSPYFNPRRP